MLLLIITDNFNCFVLQWLSESIPESFSTLTVHISKFFCRNRLPDRLPDGNTQSHVGFRVRKRIVANAPALGFVANFRTNQFIPASSRTCVPLSVSEKPDYKLL